jgi:hypothetical protein
MAVVTNLALVDANVHHIITEGGMGVLLDVIANTTASATDEEIKMAANAIRCLGRAMITDAYIEEFVKCDGVAALLKMARMHDGDSAMLDAVAFNLTRILGNADAYNAFIEVGCYHALSVLCQSFACLYCQTLTLLSFSFFPLLTLPNLPYFTLSGERHFRADSHAGEQPDGRKRGEESDVVVGDVRRP